MIRLLTTLAMLVAMAIPAVAEDVTLEMWNKDPEDKKRKMVFSEEIVTIEPGQSITWLASDKGHNVQMIAGPKGVDLPGKSKISKDVTLSFDDPGVYVYVCTPHATMGMIAMVVVGDDMSNLDDIKDVKIRGKSKRKMKELLENL